MPNIRVMMWNIETLSSKKIRIRGMAKAIARTIIHGNADIVIILELRKNDPDGILAALRAELTLEDALRRNSYNYQWFHSHDCGAERYGFLVRDLTAVRPMAYGQNPNAPLREDGTQSSPFSNLQFQRWRTWPAPFPDLPLNLPPPPKVGLTGAFFSRHLERPAAKKARPSFPGQPVGLDGFALGAGSRLPCLAMFAIQGAATVSYVPVVCCHYAAVPSGNNVLGQQQMKQIPTLHICQAFSLTNAAVPPVFSCQYLDIDNMARPVQDLILAGDWNVDFQLNQAGESKIRKSLNALTPTLKGGGSATPPAAAGIIPAAPPAVPFAAPSPRGPEIGDINNQTLRASCTTQGTMYPKWDETSPATVPRGAAFDYFLYGGAHLNTAVINPNLDSGEVIDFSANIAQFGLLAPPLPIPNIDLRDVAFHYYWKNTKNAIDAPGLIAFPGGAALTTKDRWIGARMISDHLPQVIQFTCP